MKKTKLLFSTLLLANLLSTTLFSQEKKYPEPDIMDKIYYYNETSNEAIDLEYGFMIEGERFKGFAGIGVEETLFEKNKEKSPVRIKKSDKIAFLIKLNDENTDLTKMFSLLKLTSNPKTKKRELITGKDEKWVASTSTTKLVRIRYTNKRVSETKDSSGDITMLVRLITVTNLEPGEYVFMDANNDGSGAAFFGLD
jgi:hypothetical protein